VLSSFQPTEIQAGMKEIKDHHTDSENLEIIDRYDFLTATKA
jgi:hypothetical protein